MSTTKAKIFPLGVFIFLSALGFEWLFFHLAPEINYPLLIFLFSLILILWFLRKRVLLIPKTFTFIYLIWLGAYIHSARYAPIKYPVTIEVIKALVVFLLVILGNNFFQLKKGSRKIFLLLIFVSAFWAFSGIVEYTSRRQIDGKSLWEPFHWPSLAASFFLLIFPLNLSLFLVQKKKLTQIILFISLFFIITAWILSHHYLLILGTAGFLITVAHFLSQGKISLSKQLKPLLLICFLLITILPNLSVSFGPNLVPRPIALFQNKIFFQNKTNLFQYAWKIFRQNPWWGIGPGNFGQAYLHQQTQPWDWSEFLSNELFQTLAEMGIVGFIAQLALFYYLAKLALKKIFLFKKQKELIGFSIAFSTFTFLIINFNDFSYRIFPIQLAFFLLVSFLLSQTSQFKITSKLFYFPTIFLLISSFFLLFDGYLLRIGQVSLQKKNYQRSEQILNRLSQRPEFLLNPRSLFWLSAVALEKNEPSQAINHLLQAKKINPFNDETDYQIAAILHRQGKIEEAKLILEQKIKEDRFFPPKYYLNLAKINLEQGKQKEALRLLQKTTQYFTLPPKYQENPNTLIVLNHNKMLPGIHQAYLLLYEVTNNQNYLLSLLSQWLN